MGLGSQKLSHSADRLLTGGRGQVAGLGGGAVRTILERHGITRLLASEGGRTNRGNLGKMHLYVDFLNALPGKPDLEAIEEFWIERVHEFFAGQPFKIKLDAAKSIRTVVRDVIQQAQDRQREDPDIYYAGAVMQYLVGAKLDCALGKGCFPTENEIRLAEARARSCWAKHASRFGSEPGFLAVDTSKLFAGEIHDLYPKLMYSETTANFVNRGDHKGSYSELALHGIMIYDTKAVGAPASSPTSNAPSFPSHSG